MKKIRIMAAVPVLLLAACASVDTAVNGGSTAAAPAGDTMYCWKDRLSSDSNSFTCNWADSASEACKELKATTVPKTRVAGEPVDAKRCDNGQWLVKVARR